MSSSSLPSDTRVDATRWRRNATQRASARRYDSTPSVSAALLQMTAAAELHVRHAARIDALHCDSVDRSVTRFCSSVGTTSARATACDSPRSFSASAVSRALNDASFSVTLRCSCAFVSDSLRSCSSMAETGRDYREHGTKITALESAR
jgi:hypothetical protein